MLYTWVMATLSTQTLEPRQKSGSLRGSIATAIITILLLAFPLLATAAIVPKFEEIFRDFGVALPVVTRMFIQVSRVLSTPLGWAGVLLAIGVVIVPCAMIARRTRAAAGAMLLIAMIISLVYFAALVISLFRPLTAMINSLQSGGKP